MPKSKLNQIVEELTAKAKDQIINAAITPEELTQYLKFMSKFYKYSAYNQSLIYEQRRGSEAVLSFTNIKKRHLKLRKGSHAIKILSPIFAKEEDKLTGIMEEKLVGFKYNNVFDVTDTNLPLDQYPTIMTNRPYEFNAKDNLNVQNFFNDLLKYAKKINLKDVAIDQTNQLGNARGASYPTEKVILLNQTNTPLQNIKTMIHELTHAELHGNIENNKKIPKEIKEVQAEMTAYVVCSYFGIDTSDYSVSYIADWSDNLKTIDNKNLIPVFREIQGESKRLIQFMNDLQEQREESQKAS